MYFPTVVRVTASENVEYAYNAMPPTTPYTHAARMFSKKRNDHSGAKTVTRSRKKAITRFSQWIWSVRLWPIKSKPLTMSASRSCESSIRDKKRPSAGTRRIDKGPEQPVGGDHIHSAHPGTFTRPIPRL